MIVDVAEFDGRWARIGDVQAFGERAVAAVLALDGVSLAPDAEFSLVFADDARVAELNRTYRSKDGPTNVLSFPADGLSLPDGQPRILGDVVLAFETILRESNEHRKTFENHSCHLIVHGILHLLGYDHSDEAGASEMERLEIAALASLSIPNPYETSV